MTAYSILVPFALATVTNCYNMKPFDVNEPLALTISPKVWDLLETKAVAIENAVKSMKIPDFGKKNWARMFKVWNIKITKFKVPKSGVSFENMNNAVHLKIKGAQLEARGRAKFRFLFITSGSGDVTGTTNNLNIDAMLTWRDFNFTPKVDLNSNLKIKFHGPVKILNLFKKSFVHKINEILHEKAVKAIMDEVNPHLQEFKRKIEAEGLRSYTVQLSVQKNSLRISINPKSAGNVITPLNTINDMICMNANMLALINGTHGKHKRPVGKNYAWDTRRSNSPRFQNGKKIDVTCLSPKSVCEFSKLTCSLCSDIDIKYSSGIADEFHNCLPKSPLWMN